MLRKRHARGVAARSERLERAPRHRIEPRRTNAMNVTNWLSIFTIIVPLTTGCSSSDDGARGPDGAKGEAGPPGSPGPVGTPGPPGKDGSLRVYGDGSAGDLIVSGRSPLSLSEVNTQFANITIESGATLQVSSGIILRATGTVTVAEDASISVGSFCYPASRTIPAHPGVGTRPPSAGDVGAKGVFLAGGWGGFGVPEATARQLLRPGPQGGSAGQSHGGVTDGSGGGGHGGGVLTILAQGTIQIGGSIFASGSSASGGSSGGGGGAGGIVILASPSSISIDSTASIIAIGGDGDDSSALYGSGAGGGGGGGLIHVLAPEITAAGLLDVSGGLAGLTPENPNNVTQQHAGSGGGACGGNGGRGGDISAASAAGGAEPGEPGFVFKSTVDPTALL